MKILHTKIKQTQSQYNSVNFYTIRTGIQNEAV